MFEFRITTVHKLMCMSFVIYCVLILLQDDVSVTQHKSHGPGRETLDEIADKERFFKVIKMST